MTNTQLYFAIGLPCMTIIASLILNFVSISGINSRIGDIHGRIGSLETDIHSRIGSLEIDIREIRGDLKTIVAKLGSMDLEIAKLMDRK